MNKKYWIYCHLFAVIAVFFATSSCAHDESKERAYIRNNVVIGKEKEGGGNNVPMSIEDAVNYSDLVVVGIVIDVDARMQIGPFGDKPSFSECRLKIEKVLKGKLNKNIVSIAMPPIVSIGRREKSWNGPVYQKGLDKGIWFLTKSGGNIPRSIVDYISSKGDYYFANNDSSYMSYDDKLVALILSQEKLK